MMAAVLSIAAFAALFVIYGLVRRQARCVSDCGACASPCHLSESDDAQS